MTDTASQLEGREIIVAVCGGIAAYKSADLVSKLVQAGAGVTVCMTADATKFITPLTFEALSRRKVRTDTFELVDSNDTQHIGLTERADLLLVAPATANILAKVAHGLCDDLVTLMINAAACPVAFAPSMNDRMWENPITKENVAKLQKLNYTFIGPEAGWLACRNVGAGRLAEPQKILAEVARIVVDNLPPLPPGESRGEGERQCPQISPTTSPRERAGPRANDNQSPPQDENNLSSPPFKSTKPQVRDDLLIHAREMRHEPTDAERKLWQFLRARRLGGYKFRRQHPIDGYIVDFFCMSAALGVELDGGQHFDPQQQVHDEKRSNKLAERGIKILRFPDHEVLRDPEIVAETILHTLETRTGARGE